MQIGADVREQAASVASVQHEAAIPSQRIMTAGGLAAKHTVDFLLALVGVLCLLPVFAVIGFLIKIDSRGPVFFRQKRVGRNGKTFEIYKFRTMVQGAYKMGSRLTVKRDPRITRVGAILRWSKLDELPQLINLLRGEMSLIGPRPEDPHFVEFYTATQREVLSMRPGIVGPSQIQGRDEVEDYPDGIRDTERYYVEHILPPKLARDLDYVRNTTFWLDMGLLVRGLWATVRGAFRLKYLWRRRRRLLLMGADLTMGLLTYLLAVSIRFDWDWPRANYLWQTVLIITLVRPALSVYFGVYQGITTYFGRWDLVALFKAVSVGSLAIAALTYFAGWQSHPRSVFVIDWALLMFFMAGSRYALRAWSRRHPKARWQMRERALIVGAGTGGEQISRALLEDPSAGYKPIGFIDESQDRWGSRIHGVKVLGGAAELPLAISANDVHTVFVCLSDLTENSVREVADICAGAQVECRMLPALSELLSTDPFAADRSAFGGSTAPRSAEARS